MHVDQSQGHEGNYSGDYLFEAKALYEKAGALVSSTESPGLKIGSSPESQGLPDDSAQKGNGLQQ